jgi:hypothetical protein
MIRENAEKMMMINNTMFFQVTFIRGLLLAGWEGNRFAFHVFTSLTVTAYFPLSAGLPEQ